MKTVTILSLLGASALQATTAMAQSTASSRPTQSLSISSTMPSSAVHVAPNFVGFGIESAFLSNFDNEFSANLVTNLADRLSEPPVIRVGGTSGDNFKFDPIMPGARQCLEPPCGGSNGKFVVGNSFFDGYRRFPNAMMTIEAPMENPINKTNTLAYVTNAWEALGNGSRVAAIALGNEVELIYHKGPGQYVKAALELQSAIVKELGLKGSDAKIFEAGNTATGTVQRNGSYQVDEILEHGIDKNGLISYTAEHWYQVSDTPAWTEATMQNLIINHTAISDRFTNYLASQNVSSSMDIPFVISEGAAILGGAPLTYAGGFAYALWAVDFNLASMTHGFARVANLAARPHCDRAFWTPDDSAGDFSPGPQVRAPYPAAMFVADFLGKGNASSVVEVGTDSDLLSAYAMYDTGSKDNDLVRVALCNLNLYNGSSTHQSPRGTQTFELNMPDHVTNVTVKYLRADLGVAAMGYDFGGSKNNVSWAGEQWSQQIDNGKGHLTTGQVEEDVLNVTSGKVSVDVQDSEVAMVIVAASTDANSSSSSSSDAGLVQVKGGALQGSVVFWCVVALWLGVVGI